MQGPKRVTHTDLASPQRLPALVRTSIPIKRTAIVPTMGENDSFLSQGSRRSP